MNTEIDEFKPLPKPKTPEEFEMWLKESIYRLHMKDLRKLKEKTLKRVKDLDSELYEKENIEFIPKSKPMTSEEFYSWIEEKKSQKLQEKNIQQIEDQSFAELCSSWKEINAQLRELQEKERSIRDLMITKCNDQNSQGYGVRIIKTERRGNIDYASIPQLKEVDLEQFRKETTIMWQIRELPNDS
jgi:hypothetical protein